jgi:uncharacterized protein
MMTDVKAKAVGEIDIICSIMEREKELTYIIENDKRLMNVLRIARSADLPNWYIGAGLVRNAVWDYLHDAPGKTPIRDIDFIYFSCEKIDESGIRESLSQALPDVEWDLKNSAFVHEWYQLKKGIMRPPLHSTEEDINGWPEIASCIGIQLTLADQILIYAPYGIDDLMDMVFRRNKNNPYSVTPEIFQQRVIDKHIMERWPKATIIYG